MGVALYTLAPDPDRGQPCVLFCHAAGFAGRVWNQVSREMRSQAGCFALDFRGHGNSPPFTGEETWQAFSEDVLEAVSRLGANRLIGVGHSLGGTALLLAESAAPGTFAALLCFEPILPSVDDPSFADGAARRRGRFASYEEATARFTARPPLSLLAPAVLRDYVSSGLADDSEGGVRLLCAPATEAHIYRTATQSGWQRALPRVRCPVIFMAGQNTTVVPRSYLAELASRLADATAIELPGTGHLGPLENPAAFAREVERVLALTEMADET